MRIRRATPSLKRARRPVISIAYSVAYMAVLAVTLALTGSPVARAETAGNIGQGTQLFRVLHNNISVVDASLVFWQGEWSWLGLEAATQPEEIGRRYSFRSNSPVERFSITGEAQIADDGSATWALRFSEDPAGSKNIFGGIVFTINLAALDADGSKPRPEPSADKRTWTLQLPPEREPLTITFDKPVQSLDFERGNPGELRAYVLTKNNTADSVDVKMTVKFGGTFQLSPAERLAKPDANWWPDELHWTRSPVDLSFLNASEKPAGKRGFLAVQGEKLKFEDGSVARFWGTNVNAYALFSYSHPEAVRSQARRLSKLGFNLVRLHHHDSRWVDPNIFGVKPEGTRHLDEALFNKLDWWIKCLKEEGIYVWLDLHVGRRLTERDGIDDFDEIATDSPPTAGMQGYVYVNESLQARSREFAEAYLTHVNPYTKLAYKDDPGIVSILVTNENDITHHYGNMLLPDKNVPAHSRRYMALAGEFARQHNLDREAVWRSWEFGPSKLFLADLEHRYLSGMHDHLRALGVKVPIVGTSYWGEMNAADLTTLAAGDFVDAHSYGRPNEVADNPRTAPNIASWIAGGAVAGKPFTVSEWNVEPFPVFDRYLFAPYIAAIANLQGWNATLQFAYSQSALGVGWTPVGGWEATTDPALLSLMPAAAMIFRAGHVSEAKNSYELAPTAEELIGSEINARTSRAIRTLTETSRLRIRVPQIAALPWLKPTPADDGAKRISDMQYDATQGADRKICSDTGEICRDWVRGILTIDTDKSQLAAGWLSGEGISLKDVKLAITTANSGIAVQSLDDAPINRSSRIMVSTSAQAILPKNDRPPYLTEPVTGTVEINARPGLKAYSANRDGELQAIPFETTANGYKLKLSADIKSSWIFLQ